MIIRSWWSARWGWHLATNSKQAQARSRESLFESVGRQVRMIRIFFLELNWVLKWSEMYLSNRDQYIAVLPPSQMMISIFQEKWEPPVWSRQLTSSFKASMSHLGWVNFSYKSSHFLEEGSLGIWWQIWWWIWWELWWRIQWITEFGDELGDKFGDEFSESTNLVMN